MHLILLPGMDGTGILFEPLIEALPSWIHPIVVRFPNDASLGYSELVPLIQKALPTSGDCVILGESFSGPLALMCAASSPSSLRGIILCDTFVRSPAPRWLIAAFARPFLFRLAPMALVRRQVLGRQRDLRLETLLAASLANVSAETLAARAHEIAKVDARELLRRCPVDVLILSARDDRLVGRASVDEMIAARPSVRHLELPGPHLILQTSPRQSVDLICGFIASVEPPFDDRLKSS